MSSFFKNYPITNYKFGDEETFSLFQNISAYVDILSEIANDGTFYQEYEILDIDRPDTLSYKLYNTPDYYWTFYLLNDKLRQNGWPLELTFTQDKKEELFPNYAVQLAYNPSYDSDSAGFRWVYGTDSAQITSSMAAYRSNNYNNPIALLNTIKPGSVLTGLATNYYGAAFAIVTRVDYNLGIIYFKPWGGISRIIIDSGGTGYDVPPEVVVEGTGQGAYAEALVDSGEIKSVRVYKPGYGYTPFPFSGKFEFEDRSGAGGFGAIQPRDYTYADDFVKNQPSAAWFSNSALRQSFFDLGSTKVSFKRKSDQVGIPAKAHVTVSSIELLTPIIRAYNLVEDYRNWDFRKYPGPAGDSYNYNLFSYIVAAGSFDSASTQVSPLLILSQNINNVAPEIRYQRITAPPITRTITSTMGAGGIINLPNETGFDAPYNGEATLYRYIPEAFIDYTSFSTTVTETSLRFGSTRPFAGNSFTANPWAQYDLFPTPVNESIYNQTQNYYEVPVYDPYYSSAFEPNPNGTVRLNISPDGRTGNTISGLTGNVGDTYRIKLNVTSRGPYHRWGVGTTHIGYEYDMIHHYESSGERVYFSLFDSANDLFWYDYRDSEGGYPYDLGIPNATGNYTVRNRSLNRVSNIENLEAQIELSRTIKVLKPEVVRQVVDAFQKAIKSQ